MNNTTTYYLWNGMYVSEVNLFITDILMVVVALYCYSAIRQKASAKDYSLFFLFTAISALGAGFGHLLNFYFDQSLKAFSWIFSLIANYFIVRASGHHLSNPNQLKALQTFSLAKAVIAFCFLLMFQQFFIITIDTVISIGLVSLPIHFYQWKQTKIKAHRFICAGIVFTMLTALVGGLKLSLSDEWFNHKDLNHLIICGGLWLMHKGVKNL